MVGTKVTATTSAVNNNKKPNNVDTAFPFSRIRTIMKSSLDTGQITNEVLYLMCKSTEMFVNHLTREAFAEAKDSKTLKYDDLSTYVQDESKLEFLLQIIPQKITVREFREIIAQNDGQDNSTSEDDDN